MAKCSPLALKNIGKPGGRPVASRLGLTLLLGDCRRQGQPESGESGGTGGRAAHRGTDRGGSLAWAQWRKWRNRTVGLAGAGGAAPTCPTATSSTFGRTRRAIRAASAVPDPGGAMSGVHRIALFPAGRDRRRRCLHAARRGHREHRHGRARRVIHAVRPGRCRGDLVGFADGVVDRGRRSATGSTSARMLIHACADAQA
jgi:hypothetical protein